MNGSATWQALSVTLAPGQVDNGARLRCYYAKPKESGKLNGFRCDPLPVVA